MGKRYVMINELKPEHVQDYIDMHMNCPSSEIYKGQLDALKEAGAEECIVYMWKNYSILIVKTDDIDAYMKKLGETHANQIWEEKATPWFANATKFDGSCEMEFLQKVFDMKQMVEGDFNPY